MLDLFQILACDENILPVIRVMRSVLGLLQIGVPILLIIMGAVDLGKAVMSNDDKEIKGATGKLIKRAIAAVAVFFAVTIVNIVMGLVTGSQAADSDTASWQACWEEAKPGKKE